MSLRHLAIAALCALPAIVAPARAPAQDFPAKTIRLIVPLAAGGGTDILARLVAQKLNEAWGQPVIVENRVGAFGAIASDYVARQPADGYTVLISVTGTHAVAQHLNSKLSYDPVKDFAGVTLLAYTPFVFLVGTAQPYTTLKQMVEASKVAPVQFGSPGAGSLQHIYGEMFGLQSGGKFEHVPYKGVAPANQDVVGGHIPAVLGELGTAKELIRGGQVRALAITGRTRNPAVPDVPTFAEAGYPGFDYGGWFGVWVPAATPKPVIDKLAAEINRIVKTPDIAAKISEQGWEVGGGTAEEFTKFWLSTSDRLGEVIRQRGIKVE
jgi:tripartite-type tricarboxylate transporter receptor subunit TctC